MYTLLTLISSINSIFDIAYTEYMINEYQKETLIDVMDRDDLLNMLNSVNFVKEINRGIDANNTYTLI